MKLFIFLIAIFFSNFAMAEYRVFVLKITNSTTQQAKIFKSSLDPQQYKTFYLLNANETITYVNTWRCRGSTRDFTPLCTAPNKAPQTKPSTENPDSLNVQNKS